MYNIELHNGINRILQLFYRFGFWDVTDGTSLFEFGRKMFHCIFAMSYLISMLAGAYFSNDKNESIFLFALGTANFVQVFRMFKLIFEKNVIIAILQDVAHHSTNDSIEFTKINRKINSFIKLSLYFIAICCVAVACVIILPVASSDKIPVFNIGFPLDWRCSSTSFWITHAYNVGGTFYALLTGTFSVVVWYLLFNCSIKYKILGNQLRNLGAIRATQTTRPGTVKIANSEKQKLYLEDLIEAIKNHQKINRMVCQISKFFENMFFIQIATSRLCICGSIYSLIFNTDEGVIQNAIYCTFIFYSLFDIFIVMLLGNKITESSDQLSYCLFQSDWIGQSQKCKKYVIIMAEALIQPQQLIICKLYPLRLTTFTSTLNGAYSMFNLLKNLK